MATLRVGRRSLSPNDALRILTGFATCESGTLFYYDLGGRDHIVPSDNVNLEDIGRMMLMNPGLYGSEAATLLNAGTQAPWERVGLYDRLIDADPDERDGLWDGALALFDYFDRLVGIGLAKASKLLHIKRPHFYPVLDSFVVSEYTCAAPDGGPDRCWKAVRQDLIDNAGVMAEIRGRLPSLQAAAPLVELSDVRLLDVISWSIGRFGLQAALDRCAKP